MIRTMIFVSALAVALLGSMTGSVAQEASPAGGLAAGAIDVALRDVDGQEVGQATLTEAADDSVAIEVSVEGIASGEHGIHVHEVGICDPAGDEPFSSAGDHYNPTDATHGGPPMMEMTDAATPGAANGHAGDLGNIVVDNAGSAQMEITTDRFGLAELSDAVGSALVIHADPDDLLTDPSGNSGGRIVCGVIAPSLDGGTPMATPAP